jgi:hypothetical protein
MLREELTAKQNNNKKPEILVGRLEETLRR